MTLSLYGSQQSYVADGLTQPFYLPDGRMVDTDYVVRVDGVKKTLGTNYIINRDARDARVVFGTSPTAAQVVTINRQTPRQTVRPALVTGEVEQQALWLLQEVLDAGVEASIDFNINATKLAANTTVDLVSPVQGRVAELTTIVEAAITTGGTIVPQVGTTDIAGWGTHSHAAKLTKGNIVTSVPADETVASAFVTKSGRLRLTLSGFATAGELNGFLRVRPYA